MAVSVLAGELSRSDGPDADAASTRPQKADEKTIDRFQPGSSARVSGFRQERRKVATARSFDALGRFYAAFVSATNIRHERLDTAAHTFPTDTFSKGTNRTERSALRQ